jgi:FkbM family methyltransferase
MGSKSDWVMLGDIFLDGEYDEPILASLSSVKPPDSLYVIDIGANSGFFTFRLIDLARRRGSADCIHIVAIEGSPENATRLSINLQECFLPQGGDIRVVHGLVGSRRGVGHMRELSFNAINHVATEGIAVPYVDVNQIVHDWPRVDLIKCDIEGSEYEFLNAYPDLMAKTKGAVFEFHNTDSERGRRCQQLLQSYGLTNQKILRTCAGNTIEFFRR